ncbi:MAG: hypothetical protein E3J69_10890 [Anaerolineales bacterium]|nr:MAG: hypothetical protein E3J69_10890 [Anaerolineales bacterium]
MSSLILDTLRFLDLDRSRETTQGKVNRAERLVRAILYAGFIAVLVVEISLLIQALGIIG